jgi:DNA-binding MarR family transcriptional regulator/N-acetylglutamate synthase-like GNAT family acetyltransferase
MKRKPIQEVRAFNRWYTDIIGLLNRHLLDSNYNLSEARLIYELHKAGTIQASQVMEEMHIDKSYLSRMLNRLEKDKVVARKPSREDGRAMLLSLTEKGQREFATLNSASDEQIGELVDHLNEEQREELVAHMTSIKQLIGKPFEKNAVTIRTRLEPGDLGYIAYLHGRIYARENRFGLGFESYVLEGLGEFGSRYDPGKDRVWICEDGKEIVGFLMGVDRENALQLRYFILLPEYRGMGLGKRLMDLFMGYVRERSYQRAYLWTTHEQQAAISLYIRYGFRLTEEKESMAFDKPLVERKYEWVAEAD